MRIPMCQNVGKPVPGTPLAEGLGHVMNVPPDGTVVNVPAPATIT